MSLNKQQQEAVNSNSKRFLCLAGAGTGKTHCMLSRISRLVNDGADPSSILALTFTNAAAFEMKQRYTASNPGQRIPEFRTFHSFCYSILLKNQNVRKALGYSAIPKVCTQEDVKRITAQAIQSMSITLSKAKLTGKGTLTPQEEAQYKLYKKQFKRLLRKENLITFGIMCYDICHLFVQDQPYLTEYKDRFKYIFVDEFQDTDTEQFDFIQCFPDASVTVVGDALQSIYSFRGASSAIIMDCAENGQWDVVKLYENYRSNSAICNFANENSTYARDSYRIAIHGQREGDPDSVQVFRVDKVGYGKELSSDTIELLNSFPWDTVKGTLAILARSNSEVDALQAYLTDLGVPFVSGRKKLDNVYILRSVIDSEFMVDWLTTYLNADDYSNYIRYLAIEADENPINVLLNHFGRHPKISFFLNKISTIRKIFKTDLPKMTKLCNVLKVLDVKDVMIEEEPENARDAIDYLIRLIDGDPESNIYVGTIHSSKGLEYDTVILVGVDSYHFPLNTEENKNLYYVGITRAKEKLYVFKQRYR